MANVWGGADPTGVVDAQDYEIGTVVAALKDITISSLRVWSPSNAETRVGRRGHIWNAAGTLLDTVTMPDSMTSGWTTHALSSSRAFLAGDFFTVSYETNGNYGQISAVFPTAGHVAADKAAVFPSSPAVGGVSGTGKNGRFITTPGSFPSNSFNDSFYGVDFVYTLTGATAPTVTGITLTASGLTVTATISATDPEGLSGATYVLDWGDGTTTSSASAGPHQKTYTSGGLKAILAKVTDSSALSGYRAGAIEVQAASSGLGAESIMTRLASHAMTLGVFQRVNRHELKSAPGPGLTAEIWVAAIDPISRRSGLDATSARIVYNVRLRQSMLTEPQDDIDPALAGAADLLMSALTGDFELGGTVAEIDLLGMYGQPMSARAGYLDQDGKKFRALDVLVPCILNDVWGQSA